MSWTLAQLVERLERDWPLDQAESWDNPGLAFGLPDTKVEKVLLCVDVTLEVVEEAAVHSVDLILSHHPTIFRPIHSVAGFGSTQLILQAAIAKNIALYSAHTNVDFISGGVTATLADSLALKPEKPIDATSGAGLIGRLASSLSLREFAEHVAEVIPPSPIGVLVQGTPEQSVSTVAVLAGAGDSLLEAVAQTTADVFLTSDLRHHRALDFRTITANRSRALISISHWAAESLWLPVASRTLAEMAPGVTFIESEISTDPWTFRIG